MDKIPGPNVITTICFSRRPCRDPLTGSTLFRGLYLQPFWTSYRLDKLPACCPTFLYKQGTDATLTVAGMFPGQGYNPLGQLLSFLTGLLGPVAERWPTEAEISTSPPQRAQPSLSRIFYYSLLLLWAHHFFDNVSSITWFLSIWSASSFFNSVFSFSSSLNRFASASSKLPYFLRQR